MRFGPNDASEAEVFALEELRADIQYEILRRMKDAGLSQAALAKKMNVSAAWVSQILGDDANLTLESISKVFLALGSQCKIQADQLPAYYLQSDPCMGNESLNAWQQESITVERKVVDSPRLLIKVIKDSYAYGRTPVTINDNRVGDRVFGTEAA